IQFQTWNRKNGRVQWRSKRQFVAVRMNFMSNADTCMATTWRIGYWQNRRSVGTSARQACCKTGLNQAENKGPAQTGLLHYHAAKHQQLSFEITGSPKPPRIS